jgi:gluconolactonase
MLSRRQIVCAGASLPILAACGTESEVKAPDSVTSVVDLIVYRDGAESLFDQAIPAVQLADGFTWSEGPAWDQDRDCLYFTDVPGSTAYRWSEDNGLSVFLQAGGMREPGANGLWFGADGALYVCNHGVRGVQRLNIDTGERETLIDAFEGQKFNSPNDLVRRRNGQIFFTDPPYGLDGLNASPMKEMDTNGVYRLDPDGTCTRLVSDMSFPNGVALSPDERWLYVAQSDPSAQIIRRYPVNEAGDLGEMELWFDASTHPAADLAGLPDGMAVAQSGEVFATGPGGVHVLSPDGEPLALISTGRATANCAFGGDGQDLYITAHDRLLRVRTRVSGVQWMG